MIEAKSYVWCYEGVMIGKIVAQMGIIPLTRNFMQLQYIKESKTSFLR